MDERIRFVARLLDGEKMAVVCREFGISRKTGYKIFNRYKDFGLKGLEDRAKSPYRHPNKLPFQIEKTIIAGQRNEYGPDTVAAIAERLDDKGRQKESDDDVGSVARPVEQYVAQNAATCTHASATPKSAILYPPAGASCGQSAMRA